MIEQVFERYIKALHLKGETATEAANIALITDLVAQIRPKKSHQYDDAIKSLQALCYVLNHDTQKTAILRTALLTLLSKHKPISLFLVARHSLFTGFISEMWRRMVHKVLPEAVNTDYLIDLFALFFNQTTDEEWVLAVPDAVWLQLIKSLRFDEAEQKLTDLCRHNLLGATQVLSYRIAALGLEPELLRNYPELEKHSSPFITQNEELDAYLAAHAKPETEKSIANISHILVMLDQCRAVIAKIRRNSVQTGTSVHLTYLLRSMLQNINRLETLLNIVDDQPNIVVVNIKGVTDVLPEVVNLADIPEPAELIHAKQESPNLAQVKVVQLFKELVYSECHKNDLGEHWQENMEVMALRVTENASRRGGHYITETRSEYFALLRSGMLGGLVIATMSLIKLLIYLEHLPPLTTAIFYSLNYGLGFVFIHIIGGTVATKQPAMTAAAIAASIDLDKAKPKNENLARLVATVAQTVRSQIAAIIGNVSVAVPMGMLFIWGYLQIYGMPLITTEKATSLLSEIHPWHSGAALYAGIAGICLFFSGLIAGYYDNKAVYQKIPQRLRALNWLKALLGEKRLDKVAYYIEHNLGAIASNFYFGCMLGSLGSIGLLLGLPIDIRHIAFSSAFVGFAAAGLDFMMTWQMVFYAALGLALIGFMNLTVSFSLALYVAMKSRKVRLNDWRQLVVSLLGRLNNHPAEFLLPPKKSLDDASQENSHH